MGSKTLSSHYSLIPYMRAASPCGGVGLWVSYGPYSESGERMPSCCCHAERLHSLWHAVRWHDWEQ